MCSTPAKKKLKNTKRFFDGHPHCYLFLFPFTKDGVRKYRSFRKTCKRTRSWDTEQGNSRERQKDNIKRKPPNTTKTNSGSKGVNGTDRYRKWETNSGANEQQAQLPPHHVAGVRGVWGGPWVEHVDPRGSVERDAASWKRGPFFR